MPRVTMTMDRQHLVVSGKVLDVCHRMRDANTAPPHYLTLVYVHHKLIETYGKSMVKPEVFVQLIDLMEGLGLIESWYDDDHSRYIRLTKKGTREATVVGGLLEKLKRS